jgi:ribosome-associated heat shock protein Hsp15
MNDALRRGRTNPAPTRVRLDKWLWAARFFKTRALATEAIGGGRVEVNGEKAKRAKAVMPGDRIRLRQGPYEHILEVRAVSERRGSAALAATLYEEDAAAKQRRLRLAEQHRLAAAAFAHGEGKPSKKERRELRKLKGIDD